MTAMPRRRWLHILVTLPAILYRSLPHLFRRRQRQSPEHNAPKEYPSQKAALPYCFTAVLIFAVQGLVATLGALDLVFPDLPSPISFQVGRAIHLNLSVYWPLLGSMGMGYYFFVQEAQTDLHSRTLALGQFWVFALTFGSIITALLLGYTAGREYLEALPMLKLGIILALVLFCYNLARTYAKAKPSHSRLVLAGMLTGALFILAQYVPNLFSFVHPSIENVVRFWVVHMTEEMSLELLDISAFVGLLLIFSPKRRTSLQRILAVNIVLTIIGGVFATGHHYYWIGSTGEWLWIGGVFSFIQMLGILVLAYLGYRGIPTNWQELRQADRLVLALGGSSIVYHVAGAGMLGLIMSIPEWNRYTHGTYLTSAHAHLALFGAVGMLVLTGATYILTKQTELTRSEIIRSWSGFLILNAGLLLMSTMLIIAGVLQTYLWRVTGMGFMDTHALLRPYLIIRAAGGALFALGDFLFVSALVTVTWRRLGLRVFVIH